MLSRSLDERQRRLWAAAEAGALGRGGLALVVAATGLAKTTVLRGRKELDAGEAMPAGRVRRLGAGRKAITVVDPGLIDAMDRLIEPAVRGDPESPLRWMSKSTRRLARELTDQGHPVSHTRVAQLLESQGYSLQANRRIREGTSHPDRHAQFEYLNAQIKKQLGRREPVIFVDMKKKDSIGNFKHAAREWRPADEPQKARVHDFIGKKSGKAIPFGIDDLGKNLGWISVGVNHDTASFAVNAIRTWWRDMGRKIYAKARSLLITADAGGANGARLRLWTWELQRFADDSGLMLRVHHLPPGTSKWNRIEHRLFSFIRQNRPGKALPTRAAVVNLIGTTRHQTGLRDRYVQDTANDATTVPVSDDEVAAIHITRDDFHGEWNYTIKPSNGKR